MIEERKKYCSEGIKNKELVVTKKDNEYFKNSTKCWICDKYYPDIDVEVRNHCHITRKHRCFPRI